MYIKRKYSCKFNASVAVDADPLAKGLALEVVPVVCTPVEDEGDALLAVEVEPVIDHPTLATAQGSIAICVKKQTSEQLTITEN